MPHAITAITLDLDDTLWPIDPVIERAERALHEWFERHAPRVAQALPPAEFARFRMALGQALPAISHDYTSLRREAIHRALASHGEDTSLVGEAMEVFLTARNAVTLYPDALEALERLSTKYPLAAVSNGNADLERIGLGGYFTAIVNARKVGFAKPDPRIFAAACAALETERTQVLHVGDDPELDVRGAMSFGARSAWINRDRRSWRGDTVDTHEFHDLIALCEWLDV